MTRRIMIGAAAVAVIAIAAACSDTGGDHTVATESPVPTTGAEAAITLEGGLPDYSRTTLSWNGYWYSRYNLGELTMMSGLGITFAPPAEAVMQMMATADPNPGSGEDVPMIKNAALLTAVFASADPHFAQPNNGDPMDLSNGRLDPATFDTTITPGAQGMTIIKEAEWAKLFLLPLGLGRCQLALQLAQFLVEVALTAG